MRDTRISSCEVASPLRITEAYKSWLTADAPDKVRPATTAKIVAKATAEIKPKNKLPPKASERWIAAILVPPIISTTVLPSFTMVWKKCGLSCVT